MKILFQFIRPETWPPVVVPTVRGGLQLEWHTQGVNVEVCVESPESVSFFAEHAGSEQAVELPLAGRERKLRAWLKRVFGK